MEEAKKKTKAALESGEAYKRFCEWISAQCGELKYALSPEDFGEAEYTKEIVAERDAYITHCNAEMIGNAAMILGAGRETADDVIDFLAGIMLYKKTGDKVSKGDVIARLYTNKESALQISEKMLLEAITFGDEKPEELPLVYKVVGA